MCSRGAKRRTFLPTPGVHDGALLLVLFMGVAVLAALVERRCCHTLTVFTLHPTAVAEGCGEGCDSMVRLARPISISLRK